MTEFDKHMVELLKRGVTIQTIKDDTGLYASDLARRIRGLENKGYLIERIFNEYGVKLKLSYEPLVPLQNNVEIMTGPKFTFLVISDTHLGNIYEDLSLINSVYRYAVDNNIRYVVHLGDMIEGTRLEGKDDFRVKRPGIHEQINFVTKNYPKCDKVDTLYILGNHDYRAVREGVDISKIIANRRIDMHFLGYKNSKLKIGNRVFLLHHPFTIEKSQKYDDEIKDLYFRSDFDVVLRGHTHHNGIYVNDMGSIVVNVPACYSSPNNPYIGAYEVTIKDDKLLLQSLILKEEVYPFALIHYPLKHKELIKDKRDQISKFNSRLAKNK